MKLNQLLSNFSPTTNLFVALLNEYNNYVVIFHGNYDDHIFDDNLCVINVTISPKGTLHIIVGY